ncbi:MAG: hypothetical protein Q9166_005294 [cf. Caloplaca sp. 2 TL-2023]
MDDNDNQQVVSPDPARQGDLSAWKTLEELPLEPAAYYLIACYKIYLGVPQIAHIVQRSHMISRIDFFDPPTTFGGIKTLVHYNDHPPRKISNRMIDQILVEMESESHPGHHAWRVYTDWKNGVEGAEAAIPTGMHIERLGLITKAANHRLFTPDAPVDFEIEFFHDPNFPMLL